MFFKKRKPKLNIDEIAKSLESNGIAGDIVDAQEGANELFGIGKISGEQNQELIVFFMYSYTYALRQVFDDSDISHKLLDIFHERVYNAIFKSPYEAMKFEKLVQKRYAEYYECLRLEGSQAVSAIGKALSKHFFKEDRDVADVMKMGIFAFSNIESKKRIAESVNNNYILIE